MCNGRTVDEMYTKPMGQLCLYDFLIFHEPVRASMLDIASLKNVSRHQKLFLGSRA